MTLKFGGQYLESEDDMAAEEAERKDPEIPSIPLIYDKDDSEPSALRLLYALYPEWEALPGKVRIKQFTGGVMNTVRFVLRHHPVDNRLTNLLEAIETGQRKL